MTVQETVLLDRVTGERRGTLRIHYGEPASRLEEPPIDVDEARAKWCFSTSYGVTCAFGAGHAGPHSYADAPCSSPAPIKGEP